MKLNHTKFVFNICMSKIVIVNLRCSLLILRYFCSFAENGLIPVNICSNTDGHIPDVLIITCICYVASIYRKAW